MSTSTGNISDLPLEIFQEIAKKCRGFADASALLEAIPTPWNIYTKVVLRDERDANSLLGALHLDPSPAELVQTLTYEFTLQDWMKLQGATKQFRALEGTTDAQLVGRVLKMVRNLETLNFTGTLAPWRCMTFENTYPPNIDVHLPSLKTCSLHIWMENEDFCDFGTISPFFLHPSVEILTLRGVGGDNTPLAVPNVKQLTPLKKLFLLECDLHIEVLRSALLFPIALSHLVIRQRNFFAYQNTSRSVNEIINAIKGQCESLESFEFDSLFVEPGIPMLLGAFTALKHLTASADDCFGCGNDFPPLDQFLAPNIETYTFLDQGDECEHLAEFMTEVFANKATLAPKLRKIDMITDEGFEIPEAFSRSCHAAGVELNAVPSGVYEQRR